MAGILNFLNVTVLPLQQPVSSIRKLMNQDGQLEDPDTLKALAKQVDAFIQF
jgi:hypothetical protein